MVEGLHLGIGGPYHRLERAAGLEPLKRLVPVLLAVGWAPLMLLALLEWLVTGRIELLVRDLSVHTRLLIALPLLLVAERLLGGIGDVTIRRLFEEGLVPPESAERVHKQLMRVVRWRDASIVESVLLALALLSGVGTVLGVLPPSGAIHGVMESSSGPIRMVYALVSLPMFQFFLWRSLYRWGLWVVVLAGLSRVRLRLLAAHADRRGGIEFLKGPSIAYGSMLLFALSSVVCAGWATQALLYGARIESFKPFFFALMVIGAAVALVPLLVFAPPLFKARVVGRRKYGNLVSDYTEQFERRWLGGGDRAELLGTSDIQSLADLSNTYRENIQQMGILLFGPRDLIALIVPALLTAIPLLLLEHSARDVLKRLLGLLGGGVHM